ncbi:MAG: VPLPA-CTERM sorting domain-containing protein [Ruegeria sp.]
MMKTLLTAVVAAGVALSASIASADIIWSDGFNRSSSYTVGNGWTEREKAYWDVGIAGGDQLYLFDDKSGLPDAAAMSKTVDASHYENISVMFKWRAGSKNEYGSKEDRLHLAWDLSPASPLAWVETSYWNQAWSASTGKTNWFTSTVNLGSAADMSIFNIAFWTNVSKDNEGFYLDWVKVTGDKIPTTPVPLPASGLMLLAGAGAFAAVRRRRSK